MATEADDREDPFLKKTALIRQELDVRFKEYHLSLDKRKQELCAELDTAEREYKKNQTEQEQKLRAMEQIQASIKQQTESFKAMEDSLLADVNRQIALIEEEYPEKDIQLLLDASLSETLESLASLVISILPKRVESSDMIVQSPLFRTSTSELESGESEVETKPKSKIESPPIYLRDYSKITKPVLTAVKQGDRDCDLKYPQRVAVDSETGNIFIADQTSHCVKIYNQQGQYLGMVQHNSKIHRGHPSSYAAKVELVHPYGVCLYKDSLYVTSFREQISSADLQPFIFKFIKDKAHTHFKFSNSIGVHCSLFESVFKKLTVICADKENGDVYVLDEESCVHRLDKDLNYLRLWPSNKNTNILDLQVKETCIYLSCGSSGISVVDKHSGVSQQKFAIKGDLMCVEYNYLYLINKSWNKINIVEEPSPSYDDLKVLNKLSIQQSTPAERDFEVRGVTTDLKTQKIIVVVFCKDNMLQIY